MPETGPTGESVVLGPSAYFPALLAVATVVDPTPAPGRRFLEIKAVFALAARTRATLAIPRAYRTRIGLEYAQGSTGRPPPAFTVHNGGAAVRFQACPANTVSFTGTGTVGPWTTFNGALWVAGPGCYPLELHVPAEHARYRQLVSFGGRAC